jgi:hypothetical protein
MWIELLVRHHHNLSAGLEYGANLGVGLVYLLWTCVIAYMDRVRAPTYLQHSPLRLGPYPRFFLQFFSGHIHSNTSLI